MILQLEFDSVISRDYLLLSLHKLVKRCTKDIYNYDLNQTDELLATTRAVRKRLDFDRAVPRDVIEECIGLSQQAPTGTNSQGWRWLIIEDAKKRAGLAELYKKMADIYLAEEGRKAAESGDAQTGRVLESAVFLTIDWVAGTVSAIG